MLQIPKFSGIRETAGSRAQGIKWCDLNFANDIALIDDSCMVQHATDHLTSIEEEARKVELFINPYKCKVTIISAWSDRADNQATGRILN